MKFLFFLVLSVSTSVLANEPKGMAKMCGNISGIADKIIPFTARPWNTIQMTPSGPVPGIFMALLQEDNVILEFCKFYKQLQELEKWDKSILVADYANKLSGNAFNEEVAMFKSTYDMGLATQNFNSVNGGTLDKLKAYAPKLNSFMGDARDYSESKGYSAEIFHSRSMDEEKMQQMMEIARKQEILKEQANCTFDEARVSKSEYSADTSQKEEELKYLEEDMKYLRDQILSMGIRISPNPKGYEEFAEDAQILFLNSSEYVSGKKSYEVNSVEKTSSGKTKEVKKNIDYQVFSVTKRPEYLDVFLSKYEKKWKDFVTSESIKDSKDLFNDKSSKIQLGFYDRSFECRESQMLKKAKVKNPGFFTTIDDGRATDLIKQITQECENENKRVFKVDNLLRKLAEHVYETSYELKRTQGDLWTIDSYYNGTVRSIENRKVKVDGKEVLAEDVACSREHNYADLKAIQLKALQLEGEQRAILLENNLKKTNFIQEKMEREKREREQAELDRAFAIKKRNNFVETGSYGAPYSDNPEETTKEEKDKIRRDYEEMKIRRSQKGN